jgi:FAD/FMN-containing dehydrogenase
MVDSIAAQVLGAATVQELREGLRGEVIAPGDDAYDAARARWNGMIDRRPALIARCVGVADVMRAVQFAQSEGLVVAVRGGGHNVAGFSVCDGGLVIDLSAMQGARLDPRAQTIRAEAGLTWGPFDHETQAFGLATTGGLVTTTGIAGLTLGGGIGWLMRKHGLTCDNLIAADVVTAEGKLVTAGAGGDEELLWGLRGGGGNFGIVTSFEYRLRPVGPLVLGGAVFYPAEKARELLQFYREWTPTQPDALTTMVAFLTAPPAPFIPTPLQGTPMVAVALCYAGPLEDGEKVIRPLREFAAPAVDVVGPMPYVALQGMFDAGVPWGIQSYWRTEYLDELGDGAINALVTGAARMRSPFSAVHLHHLEGAVRHADAGTAAFGRRDARYVVNVVGLWMAPDEAAAHIEWVRATGAALRPFVSGGAYLNFLGDEGQERVRAAYGPSYPRLAALKRRYDPGNFFRLNQNIPPA